MTCDKPECSSFGEAVAFSRQSSGEAVDAAISARAQYLGKFRVWDLGFRV